MSVAPSRALAQPTVVVVMGVSGSGKSTIGIRLAEALGYRFQEGDDLHPSANVEKMRSGRPLTDADRAPWLEKIAALIDGWRARGGEGGVITCSALKRAYRAVIIGDRPGVRLVFLEGSYALIRQRVEARRGHFMPPALLDSQFADLEPPTPDERPIIVGVEDPPEVTVATIIGRLESGL
jgi:carbohydrate kinase (thermoresistant glucokinase family)